MLKCEINTAEMEVVVLRYAKTELRRRNLQADFEHGQWWITHLPSGAQWSVCDANTPSGFCFEQVSMGDSE